jgi:hypothetical protein
LRQPIGGTDDQCGADGDHRDGAPASPWNVDSVLQSLTEADNSQVQPALVAGMRLGRELSPMQLLALALIGGFIAGAKLGK